MTDDRSLQVKHAVDIVMAPVVASSLLGYLPSIAAFLGICWYLMQMYDWIMKKVNKKRNLKRRQSDE